MSYTVNVNASHNGGIMPPSTPWSFDLNLPTGFTPTLTNAVTTITCMNQIHDTPLYLAWVIIKPTTISFQNYVGPGSPSFDFGVHYGFAVPGFDLSNFQIRFLFAINGSF